jgi:hypothetical protein
MLVQLCVDLKVNEEVLVVPAEIVTLTHHNLIQIVASLAISNDEMLRERHFLEKWVIN